MTAQITILIRDRPVRTIISAQPVEVTIIGQDIDGIDPERIEKVEGIPEHTTVWKIDRKINVGEKTIEGLFSHSEKQKTS
jgi:hypothetical protein